MTELEVWDGAGLAQTGKTEAMATAELVAAGVEFRNVGLLIPDDLTDEQFRLLAALLAVRQQRHQWHVADLLVVASRYGLQTQIAQAFGVEAATVHDWTSVARRVQSSSRNEVLPFTHHRIVAALTPAEQRLWLEESARNRWSAATLREKIAEAREEEAQLAERRRRAVEGSQEGLDLLADQPGPEDTPALPDPPTGSDLPAEAPAEETKAGGEGRVAYIAQNIYTGKWYALGAPEDYLGPEGNTLGEAIDAAQAAGYECRPILRAPTSRLTSDLEAVWRDEQEFDAAAPVRPPSPAPPPSDPSPVAAPTIPPPATLEPAPTEKLPLAPPAPPGKKGRAVSGEVIVKRSPLEWAETHSFEATVETRDFSGQPTTLTLRMVQVRTDSGTAVEMYVNGNTFGRKPDFLSAKRRLEEYAAECDAKRQEVDRA